MSTTVELVLGNIRILFTYNKMKNVGSGWRKTKKPVCCMNSIMLQIQFQSLKLKCLN